MNLFIFDIDGTLCNSGQVMNQNMIETLNKIKEKGHSIGLVGGGTYQKIHLQTTQVWNLFDFVCCENGQHSFKNIDQNITEIYKGSIRNEWGDELLTKIVTILLKTNSKLKLNVKTGKFIDLRNGLLYWSLIGQNCTQNDRKKFKILDQKYNIRSNLIKKLSKNKIFRKNNIHLSLGGELGIAITPPGWDKSFPFIYEPIIKQEYLNKFNNIYFYGDKMEPDGSDYPMHKVKNIKCIAVSSPEDCINKIKL